MPWMNAHDIRCAALESAYYQGDIIDNCPIYSLESTTQAIDLDAPPTRWVERVIVVTQACDVAQAKSTKVVVATVHSAQVLVNEGILKASTIRDQIRRGFVYGWYFLPASPGAIGLPESVVDLRDLHTISHAVLDHLVANGKRTGRLLSPYREHLAQHFAVTYMRIGLPTPYETETP
jgi:hypothetical protein